MRESVISSGHAHFRPARQRADRFRTFSGHEWSGDLLDNLRMASRRSPQTRFGARNGINQQSHRYEQPLRAIGDALDDCGVEGAKS